METVSKEQNWAAGFISLGAILGITTVLIVMLYGQTRLFYAISRDGLLPKALSEINPKTKTPTKSVVLTGGLVAIFGVLVPLDTLAELTNFGTLLAFIVVSIGIEVLRKTKPDPQRSFKVPFVPVIPILSVIFCGYLLFNLPKTTWIGFIVWLLIGLVVYFGYSYRNSSLKLKKESQEHFAA